MIRISKQHYPYFVQAVTDVSDKIIINSIQNAGDIYEISLSAYDEQTIFQLGMKFQELSFHPEKTTKEIEMVSHKPKKLIGPTFIKGYYVLIIIVISIFMGILFWGQKLEKQFKEIENTMHPDNIRIKIGNDTIFTNGNGG